MSYYLVYKRVAITGLTHAACCEDKHFEVF